ncbi:MAG: DUF4392 domain-containing protein [Halieaceae bacterium]|jgi:hypothetical protein|nr:DUF4392 domain-containing protein [Halieaceae bacterium]
MSSPGARDALDTLSESIEARLVAANPRGMQHLRAALEPGYCLRAARLLQGAQTVLIATGFPVDDTFETDGPLGSIALYRALEQLGGRPVIATANPMANRLRGDFRLHLLEAYTLDDGRREARRVLDSMRPDAIVSIERPGLNADGCYYNMRGEDISARCAVFDYYLELAQCPTIAIGDGGNEIGMGRVADAVAELAIRGSSTGCDELIVADVSNWGAYALVAVLQALSTEALLDAVDHSGLLAYLCERGSVDGVTRENTPTEDGMPMAAGEALLEDLRQLVASFRSGSDRPFTAPGSDFSLTRD